jgi:hypothetical protein
VFILGNIDLRGYVPERNILVPVDSKAGVFNPASHAVAIRNGTPIRTRNPHFPYNAKQYCGVVVRHGLPRFVKFNKRAASGVEL